VAHPGDTDARPAPPDRPPAVGPAGPAPGRTVSLAARPRRTLRLADAKRAVRLDRGTFLQRSGVSLFLCVLAVAAAVILALFLNLVVELGRAPRVPDADAIARAFAQGDTLQALRLAAQYRAMGELSLAHRDAAWTHFAMGIKDLVVTVFFPLLTGILGYVFGTQAGSSREEAQG
jgi:hypothetical protein